MTEGGGGGINMSHFLPQFKNSWKSSNVLEGWDIME